MRAKAKIGPSGRVVIPAAFRKEMGLKAGDEVLMRLEDGEVTLYTRAQAIRRAQELVRRYVPKDVSLADELIAERRREVEQEEAEAAQWRAKHKTAE